MLTNWTNKEHTARRQTAAMPGVCLKVGLGSPVNSIYGKLGEPTRFIDSRQIKH